MICRMWWAEPGNGRPTSATVEETERNKTARGANLRHRLLSNRLNRQSRNATFLIARDSFSVFIATRCHPCSVMVL